MALQISSTGSRAFAQLLGEPSDASLKVVRGSLKKIAKEHRSHWPNVLVH